MTRDPSRPAPTSSADPGAPVPWWGKASDRWLLIGVLVLLLLARPLSFLAAIAQATCWDSESLGCGEGGLLLIAPIRVAPVVVVGLVVVAVSARWLRLIVIRRSIAALFTVQFLAFVVSFATAWSTTV